MRAVSRAHRPFLPNQASVYQPDLLVICEPAAVTRRGIEGVPVLVGEILSPSTMRRDLWTKRQCYEAAGVLEYFIVDPEERDGLLLRLLDGRYQEVARVQWGDPVPLLGGRLTIRLG